MSNKNKSAGTVDVKFAVPAFRYEGVEYNSAAVEKAAEAGDDSALTIIANLVQLGSGIVEVIKESEEPEAPNKPKAAKAIKTEKEVTHE